MINFDQQNVIISSLKKRIHPRKIGVFGSFARNENKPGSDLDILVFLDHQNKVSLLELIGAEQELSEVLGLKVDLVTDRSINPLIRPYIEKDLKIIFND